MAISTVECKVHNEEPLHFREGRNMCVHWHWTMTYAPATLISPQNSPSAHFGINPWLVCLNNNKKKNLTFFFVTTKITKSNIFSRNIYKLGIYVHTIIYKLLTCIWIIQLCHYFLNINSYLPSCHKLSSIKLIFVIYKIIQKNNLQ